jgi:hypothetical protein
VPLSNRAVALAGEQEAIQYFDVDFAPVALDRDAMEMATANEHRTLVAKVVGLRGKVKVHVRVGAAGASAGGGSSVGAAPLLPTAVITVAFTKIDAIDLQVTNAAAHERGNVGVAATELEQMLQTVLLERRAGAGGISWECRGSDGEYPLGHGGHHRADLAESQRLSGEASADGADGADWDDERGTSFPGHPESAGSHNRRSRRATDFGGDRRPTDDGTSYTSASRASAPLAAVPEHRSQQYSRQQRLQSPRRSALEKSSLSQLGSPEAVSTTASFSWPELADPPARHATISDVSSIFPKWTSTKSDQSPRSRLHQSLQGPPFVGNGGEGELETFESSAPSSPQYSPGLGKREAWVACILTCLPANCAGACGLLPFCVRGAKCRATDSEVSCCDK